MTEDDKGNVRIEQCGTNLCGYAVGSGEKVERRRVIDGIDPDRPSTDLAAQCVDERPADTPYAWSVIGAAREHHLDGRATVGASGRTCVRSHHHDAGGEQGGSERADDSSRTRA